MGEVLKKMVDAELNYTILEIMLENANGKSEKFNQLSDLDGLDWRIILKMLEVLFRFTYIKILVCRWENRQGTQEKTVDCYHHQIPHCRKSYSLSLCAENVATRKF